MGPFPEVRSVAQSTPPKQAAPGLTLNLFCNVCKYIYVWDVTAIWCPRARPETVIFAMRITHHEDTQNFPLYIDWHFVMNVVCHATLDKVHSACCQCCDVYCQMQHTHSPFFGYLFSRESIQMFPELLKTEVIRTTAATAAWDRMAFSRSNGSSIHLEGLHVSAEPGTDRVVFDLAGFVNLRSERSGLV